MRFADLAERFTIVGLFSWLAARLVIAASATGEWAGLLLIPSEGLVALFVLLRRPATSLSQHWLDWILAASATACPFLVAPRGGEPVLPVAVCATLSFAGVVIQLRSKLALGRSFGCVPAHRGLKFAGPYQFVRHPMYAGYLVSHAAFLAMNPSGWNLAVYAVCYGVQVPRLLAEERLLAEDPAYRRYQVSVRYRLLPGLF